MTIVFETEKCNTGDFTYWLSTLKEVDDSLVLEIDVVNEMFVGKTFTADKTIVKYGKIPFSEAGFELHSILDDAGNPVSIDEWKATHPQRIYIGLLRSLDKFSKQIEYMSNEDSVYKFIVRFEGVNLEKVGDVFMATQLELKSHDTSLVPTAYHLNNFQTQLLDDSVFFDRVCVLPKPLTFELTNREVGRLSKVTGLFNDSDAKAKGIIKFYVSQSDGAWWLCALDATNKYYDVKVSGTITSDSCEPVDTASPIAHNNFYTAFKGDKSSKTYLTVTSDANVNNGKMKIVSEYLYKNTDGEEVAKGLQFIAVIANVRT